MAKPKKSGLGKGLGALLSEEVTNPIVTADGEQILKVDINLIKPNPNQPRTDFDLDKIESLAESIKDNGLIQPIVVKQLKKGYEIIAGERRWRAAKTIPLKEIDVIVREATESEIAQLALIENLQREDLNDIEQAVAYKSLVDEYDLTQEKVAKLVGKSRTYVTNTMRLLNLENSFQNLIREGQITSGHGRAILSLKLNTDRQKVVDLIINKTLSVRETEDLVKKLSIKNETKAPKREKPVEIQVTQNNLMDYFATKVNIKHGVKKGKIEIEYYGEDDLNRILDLMKK